MTISSIYSNSSSATLGLISGTGEVQSSSVSDVVSQSQGSDQANISQGAKAMGKLANLATTDPEKFKEAAQKIADGLKEKAENTTDTDDKQHLTEMASQFEEAAETGSMDSLKPPSKPEGSAMNGSSLSKYSSGGDKSNMMSSIDSIISNALSSVGASSTSSSSSSSISSSSTIEVSVVQSSSDTAA